MKPHHNLYLQTLPMQKPNKLNSKTISIRSPVSLGSLLIHMPVWAQPPRQLWQRQETEALGKTLQKYKLSPVFHVFLQLKENLGRKVHPHFGLGVYAQIQKVTWSMLDSSLWESQLKTCLHRFLSFLRCQCVNAALQAVCSPALALHFTAFFHCAQTHPKNYHL